MPEDGFRDPARATVVEQSVVVIDHGNEADAPERRRPPLRAGRFVDRAVITQFWSHVVQQKVGVGQDDLAAERLDRMVACGQLGYMAALAAGGEELLGPLFAAAISTRRGRGQRLVVEDDRVEAGVGYLRISA